MVRIWCHLVSDTEHDMPVSLPPFRSLEHCPANQQHLELGSLPARRVEPALLKQSGVRVMGEKEEKGKMLLQASGGKLMSSLESPEGCTYLCPK